MRVWIVCCGAPAEPLPKRCTGAEFEAAMAGLAEAEIAPYGEKPLESAGRRVYVAPGLAARQTAEQMYPGAAPIEEPLLAPIPQRAFRDADGPLPLWLWQEMAKLQRRAGSPRQPESEKAAAQRAEVLIARLEAEGADCILVSDKSFVAVLLDRMRLHSCTFARSGIFQLQAFERILVTGRALHCGGCGHNCLLENPGCGIGRDKAARLKQGYHA